MGKGVLTAVKNVNEIIAPALIGMDPTKQVWGARKQALVVEAAWHRERPCVLQLQLSTAVPWTRAAGGD